MQLDIIANSKNDEFYTPAYAVKPIIKYLTQKGYKTVWCPFDTVDSNFVITLKAHGFNVIYSHIQDGKDFFFTLPDSFDCIVSNPPYSIKTEILERLFNIGKPFAVLLGVAGLFESQKRFNMFANNDFEIMYLSKRVAYFKSFDEPKPSLNPPFSSVYICKDVLDKPICFEVINKCS